MKFSLGALMCAASLFSLIALTSVAKADSQPYCAAYARDLASRKIIPPTATVVSPAGNMVATTASISPPSEDEAKMERLWQRAYKSALRSCLEQYSAEKPKPVMIAPKAVKTVEPAKPAPKKLEKQASADDDGPKRGSAQWKKDCLAQHPSFNADTGTYRTYSGVQRECGK